MKVYSDTFAFSSRKNAVVENNVVEGFYNFRDINEYIKCRVLCEQ